MDVLTDNQPSHCGMNLCFGYSLCQSHHS